MSEYAMDSRDFESLEIMDELQQHLDLANSQGEILSRQLDVAVDAIQDLMRFVPYGNLEAVLGVPGSARRLLMQSLNLVPATLLED